MTFITATRPVLHAARLGLRDAHITLTHGVIPKITNLFANGMPASVGRAAAAPGSAFLAWTAQGRGEMASPASSSAALERASPSLANHNKEHAHPRWDSSHH